MRARELDAPRDAGALFGLERGLVGIGDVLNPPPCDLDQALARADAAYGAKAARMLRRFAALPDRTLVWTSTGGQFHLGRISGPWRYDTSAAAAAVGIHHVRPTDWLATAFGADEIPAAVAATFARGGRNLQRIRDADAERVTARLWHS
jgi:predicted Mrr-cat superfamily restriction endonuclease